MGVDSLLPYFSIVPMIVSCYPELSFYLIDTEWSAFHKMSYSFVAIVEPEN